MKQTALVSKKSLPAVSQGFTLIELLIVIALLGALAVGLLATIDPFEQLKKGRDTSTRNTVSEFYDALIRYYSIKADFPWVETSPTAPTSTAVPLDDPAAESWITAMVSAGELKNGFVDLAGTGNLAKIYVYQPTTDKAVVCFQPESKSFRVDPNTVYDRMGNTAGLQCLANPNAQSPTACYFCIQ